MITIENVNYVLSDDTLKQCPLWSKSNRNGRELVKKKKIPADKFIFAKLLEDKWVEASGKSIKFDKVLIKKEYLDSCEQYIKETTTKTVVNDNRIEKSPEIINLDDEEKLRNNIGIEKAPDIINLSDDEKFRDNTGKILEIETRGIRDVNNIFFKSKDVSEEFNLPNLIRVATDKLSGYKLNDDYVYFYCEKVRNHSTDKKTYNKEIFFTYNGLLRVLFVSRSGTTKKFVSWATKTLFTVQMGLEKQKEKLSSKLLNVSLEAIEETFKKCASTTPCIYLYTLNTVKELRESMSIDSKYPNEYIVCKYGYTNDISRRTGEHKKTYGRIKNVVLNLKYYSYTDPIYISKAESSLKQYFSSLNVELKYKNYTELIVVDPELLKKIKIQYEDLHKAFAGHSKELIYNNEILKKDMEYNENILKKDFDMRTKELIHNNEILKKNMEYNDIVLKKDLEAANIKIDFYIKEIEMLKTLLKNTK